LKKLLQITLGILTAIGGMIDIGNLVANPQAGARFGMGLAWVIVLGAIGIILYAEMAGRVAAISHHATFDVIRERLGPRVALANLIASVSLTVLTLIAEIGGVALVLELGSGINYLVWIPILALLVWLVVWRVKFQAMEKVYGLMGVAMLVVLVAVWRLHPDWGQLWHQASHPSVPPNEDLPTYLYFAIAQLGSVMMPYQVLFFSSGAVEEGWTRQDLFVERANVYIGFSLGTLIALALMTGATLVLAPRGINVEQLSQAALPTAVALGRIGLLLLFVGMFAAVFGAALETAMSSGYSLAQYFGWQWGKMVAPAEASRFHLSVLVAIVVAASAALTTVDPIKVTEFVVVLSAAAMPLTYLPILIVANDPDYMDTKVNSRLANVLASGYLVLLVVVALATVPLMIVTKLGA
jgi:manganese transport protein